MKKICIIILILLYSNAFAEIINGVSRYGKMEWGLDTWGDSNIFSFGQDIPLEDMQGTKLTWDEINWEETTFPSPHVIKISHAQKLITGDIGKFAINWSLKNGVKFIRDYETGAYEKPAKEPVIIYYNSNTKAPLVDIKTIPIKTFYFNSMIYEKKINDEDPNKVYLEINEEKIKAKGPDNIEPTYIILQCDKQISNNVKAFIGIEIIQIKEYKRDIIDTGELNICDVNVGSRLLPYKISNNSEPYSNIYAHILTGDNNLDEEKLIYQHMVEKSPQYKNVWAIGENDHPAKMEIIWMKKSNIGDIYWPFEFRQYTSRWPKDNPEKYQLYVRGNSDVLGPDVSIPSELNPEIVKTEFNSSFNEAQLNISSNDYLFTTNGSQGWVLLKYGTGSEAGKFWVGFEVVKCVDHEDKNYFDLNPKNWDIGKEIVDSYHEGYTSPYFLPGYIHIPVSDACNNCDRYAPAIYDQINGGTGQIFAVNKGIMEIWWFNLSRIQDPEGSVWPDWPENMRVLWPSKVKRYNAVWPKDSKSIIIARQNGTDVIKESKYGNEWDIYFQNDSSMHGYNPNEEHAAIYEYKTGRGIFPLRNDLNILETSEPYVLMKYKEQPENKLWRFDVYKVFDEKAPYFFKDWTFLNANVTIVPEIFEEMMSDNIFKIDPSDDERQITIKKGAKIFLEKSINGKKFEEVAAVKKAIHNCLAIIPQNITALNNSSELENTKDEIIENSEKIFELTEEEIIAFQMALLKYIPETDPYEKYAGFLIQPPFPISTYPYCEKNEGISGPFFEDRNNNHWFMAAGDDEGTSEVVMQFYYPALPEYYFPKSSYNIGDQIPLLEKGKGFPIDITYTIFWPDTPIMKVNQTLIESMYGLPAIKGQKSVDILYQQSIAKGQGESVILIDPTKTYSVFLESIPDEIITENNGAEKIFIDLSLALRNRVSYDPLNQQLKFKGVIIDPVTGFDYALLNVMSELEYNELIKLDETQDTKWSTAVKNLYDKSKSPILIRNSNTDLFDNLALTSGFAKGSGYVTLIMQNKEDLGALPVSLEIIKVVPELNPGNIIVITPRCPFDEKLTLRHASDFGGRPDDFVFEWQYLSVSDDDPDKNIWRYFDTKKSEGLGAIDITIKGPGLFTLSDNMFKCRYKYIGTEMIVQNEWSEWTYPQLAEGWIKRVVGNINPYTQRASGGGIDGAEDSFFAYIHEINTIISMISQAGPRWEGSIPMNCDNIDDYGLIEIYETVSKRGKYLSIDYGYNYPSANNALLLVASRISDLYMLLGNEAYADSIDPTIGFGTDDGIYGQVASSTHCFMNMMPNLIDEELALLRGRNDDLLPGVRTAPVYNRLYWNFSDGPGEVAYVLNYNILDVNDDPAGHINEADARQLYPQGHGDAYGHYLSAIKIYYQLLTHPNYDWNARSENILIGGVPFTIDYLDERKFAAAAAAKARAGDEIINLTYRKNFLEDPEAQWQGYKDTDVDRAWGFSQWASRSGQGAFIDWVVANAILPEKDNNPKHTGIEKIDRTTVSEIYEISSHFIDIQAQVDNADKGLNPLGLAGNVIPFDIDPVEIENGKTHFEQIYDRAVKFLNNSTAVFNHAVNSTQLLRRQADSLKKFQDTVKERENSFNSQLIEIFGYPYPEDIGTSGTYPAEYNGPDIYHYMYIDPSELVGDTNISVLEYNIPFKELEITEDGGLVENEKKIIFHLSASADRFGFVKPSKWTGERIAPGEIQMVRSDLIQARARFERALEEYNQLILQIENQAQQLEARYNMNQDEIIILNDQLSEQITLNDKIKESRERQMSFRKKAQLAITVSNAIAEAPPKSIIAGLCGGGDMTSVLRSTLMRAGTIIAEVFNNWADKESISELDHQHSLQELQANTNVTLVTERYNFENKIQIKELELAVHQEISKRIELLTLQEVLQQTSGRYLSVLARGQRLLEERNRFRKQTAGDVQSRRYKDMAFRIFRNEALQKYRSQFDLAARYVYLAAKAYDYETAMLSTDSRAGQNFMTEIVRKRLIGTIINGIPQTGTGLADPLKQMSDNFEVFKGQYGFSNPQKETDRFSLRTELFRIKSGYDGNKIWRKTLHQYVVPNLLDLPEFQQYARKFSIAEPIEPGIVIPFNTSIFFGQNFFGWTLAGGDSTYNSSNFTTKVRSAGVWFSNYNNLTLSNTPYVYLIPVGNDIIRSPTDGSGVLRIFKVIDQILPMPFQIDPSDLNNPNWISIPETTPGFADIRKFSSFKAFHDSGQFNSAEIHKDSRLIGRSVWNNRWLLIIPAGSFHGDRDEGLNRFIDGNLIDGQRDGNGVTDIKLFFETYSYSGCR